MPHLSGHVDCCGISHAYGFRITDSVEAQQKYLEYIDLKIVTCRVRSIRGEGRLLELTLIDQQLERMPVFRKGLKKRGFKLVSRFLNRNSGNYVNVLHLRPHNRLHGSPYWKED